MAISALAGGLLAGNVGTASAARFDWMVKNTATGKCLEGTPSFTVHAVTMVRCNAKSPYQRFAPVAGKLVLVFGSRDVGICVGVQGKPDGPYPREVVTVNCSDKNYDVRTVVSTSKNSPIGFGEAPCVLGHYGAADTFPSCYVREGNNTKWSLT